MATAAAVANMQINRAGRFFSICSFYQKNLRFSDVTVFLIRHFVQCLAIIPTQFAFKMILIKCERNR